MVLLVGGAGESAETTWNTAENAEQVLKLGHVPEVLMPNAVQ